MLSLFEPFGDLGRFQRDMERGWAGQRTGARSEFFPAVDVVEEKEAIVVRAEVPGIKREEIDVSLDGNILTLKGQRKLEKEEEGKRYHRVERDYGAFVRHFQLPTTVEPDKIEAKLAEGILTLRIPKKELVKARKINVAD